MAAVIKLTIPGINDNVGRKKKIRTEVPTLMDNVVKSTAKDISKTAGVSRI